MIEVERKYLVKNNSYKMQAQRAGLIVQGYLGDNPLSETRIAIRDNHGWLFIKAKGPLVVLNGNKKSHCMKHRSF